MTARARRLYTGGMTLREWYEKTRLTADQIAEKAKISRPVVFRALAGDPISRPKAMALAKVTKGAVDPRDLVFPDLAK